MVSIIIPTYKRPDRLLKALNSVINQTYKDIEILVIDDDPEKNELPELLNTKYDKIRYFKNERKKGANGARNTGIIHAKGSFIAFLDDDDEWFSEKLDIQLGRTSLLDGEWAGCYCGWITDKKSYTTGLSGNLLIPFLEGKIETGSSSTLLFKKEVIDQVGFWDEELIRHQDWDYMVRVFLRFKFCFIEQPLVIVNGHNFPSFNIAKQANEMYLNKIKTLIIEVPQTTFNVFMANRYRDIAALAAINGKLSEAVHYTRKSTFYKTLSPYGYSKMALYLLNAKTFRTQFGGYKSYMHKIYSADGSNN